MSAPQRSSGRLVSRRVPPASGAPGSRPGAAARVPNAAPATALPVPPAGGAAFPGLPVTGPHPMELAGLLHQLSARLLAADDTTQALDRLAVFTAEVLPEVLSCSVALIGEGEPLTRAASGPQAKALDDRQYAVGQGPGLDATRTRALVTVDDLAADERWPELADCARAAGVHAAVAIPLDVARTAVGALCLFVARPGGAGPELLITAMALVNQAEVLLGELDRRTALSEGATVDRAAGVIIAQRGCGVQEAYDILQETAQRLGIDRRAVAERLIAAAARNAGA